MVSKAIKASEVVINVRNVDRLLIRSGSLFYGKRMLASDAEEFIVEEVTMGSARRDIHLKIYLHEGEASRGDEIGAAIHQHFTYRRKKSERELRRILQLGWQSLLISIVFLGILISLTLVIIKLLPEGGLSLTFREILIILGWVALWRPADRLLYEWRPFKREVNLFRKLEQCEVEIAILE